MDDITQSRFPRTLKDQLIVFLVCCMAWLIPAHALAATDIYYFQHTVAGNRVCGGDVTPTWTTPTYSQSVTGEANILPAGGSFTSNTGFPGYQPASVARLINWDPGTGTTGIGMYTVPYNVPMTIAGISLRVSYTIVNSTIQSQPGFARFYDVDGNAACSNGVLIGQTPNLVFPLSKVTLNLSGLSYNIQPGHRIRVELWHYNSWVGGASGEGSMSITYGTGTDSGLIIDQTPTSSETCTVGPGSLLPDASLVSGGPETALNTFTLQTSTGTDTALFLKMNLTTGSSQVIETISVKSDDESITYGSVLNPASDSLLIPLSTPITATTTSTQYKIMVKPKTKAIMSVSWGASYAVQGFVDRLDSSYTKIYSDTPSATVTISNITSGIPVWGSVSAGDSSATLNWTNPTDSYFQSVLILRGTAPLSTNPIAGNSYSVGMNIGTGTVVYTGTSQTIIDSKAPGDPNGISYYYKIFSRDTDGNFSPGAAIGPLQIGLGTAVVGNGTDPANSVIGINPASITRAVLDSFTVNALPSANLGSVTVSLAPGASQYIQSVELTNDTFSVSHKKIDSPSSDTLVFSGLNLPITNSPTSFKVSFLPKLNTPPPAGTVFSVTGTVTGILFNNLQANVTYADTTSAQVRIDHLPPANPTFQSVTASDSRVNLSWVNPANIDNDLSSILILRSTSPVTDKPVDGYVYAQGSTIGNCIVVYSSHSSWYGPDINGYITMTSGSISHSYLNQLLAAETGASDTGLVNLTPYYYKIFARDLMLNYSSGLEYGAVTPNVTITLGNGYETASTIVGPGTAAVALDAFTLSTSGSTVTVTGVTVALSAGASTVISAVRITSNDGLTVYGTIANPASDTVVVGTSGLSVNSTSKACKVEIIPKSHAEMPALPGAEVVITGTVTAITTAASAIKVYNDTSSATLTLDNLSPANPAGAMAVPLNGGFLVNWANPGNADFSKVLLLRSNSAVADIPVEGVDYGAGGFIGGSLVVYAGTQQSIFDRGLLNGNDYYYRLFTVDTRGNYSSGVLLGPQAPNPNSQTLAGGATAVIQGLDTILVTMPYTEDANSNGTCTVEYKLSAAPAWTPWTNGISRSPTSCVTTITGITAGSYYDVRMTYSDSDGVLGTASKTVTGIVALSLIQTTAGNVTATFDRNQAGPNDIVVHALYTNDHNNNNSCRLEYKKSSDSNWTLLEGYIYQLTNGQYIGFVVGLQQMIRYDVRVTFIDPDGVNGTAVQTISGLIVPSAKNTRLIHNSLNANKKGYWSQYGGWGVPGGQYGEFTCKTCHALRAGNVAGIRSSITLEPLPWTITPDSNWGGLVRFDGPESSTYGFGDDSVARPFPPPVNRICEVCHTLTRGGPGYMLEADKPAEHRKIQPLPANHNPTGCTRCHTHDTGFKSPF